MKISLEHISKRFQRHWIFKDINFSFPGPGAYAILGNNGSGKSTLLRIIAGMQSPSAGKVHYNSGTDIPYESRYKDISFCAPAQELVEEFTLREFLEFHFSFRQTQRGMNVDDIISATGLSSAADKFIYNFSSGMKQRVKLAQAIFSDTPVLLLDEPCTNLDDAGVLQYRNWIEDFTKNRLVIVASNDIREYYFCKEHINMQDYL